MALRDLNTNEGEPMNGLASPASPASGFTMTNPSIASPRNPEFSPNLHGLSKSASVASSGSYSCRSVSSIPVTGAHPFGTLHIHQPVESPLSREMLMKPLPDEPPPLEDEDGTHTLGGGDVVLVLDLPSAFTVGYDSVSFTTRTFYGVRDLPPGAHFFWVSETEASTTRSGFWILSDASSEKIHVMQWDKFNEVISEPASQVEVRIQRDNILATYPKLTAYQYRAANANLRDLQPERRSSPRSSPMPEPDFTRNTNIWQQLTSHISAPLLARITGRQSTDWAVHTSDRVRGALILPAELELDKRVTSVVTGTELAFAFSQAAKTFSLETTGAARTEQATDTTSHIASLTDNTATSGISDDDLVGELQFAFIVGMHLGNEACIQQWWHLLLAIVLKAYALPLRKPVLARALLQTITAQLVYNDRYLDGSILDYGPSNSRDLRLSLIVYKRRLNELLLSLNSRATPEQAAVGQAFSELESTVWKFGWDIRSDYLRAGKTMLEDGEEVEVEMSDLEAEDERGEFAAVVVELDDKGRQKDLVAWG